MKSYGNQFISSYIFIFSKIKGEFIYTFAEGDLLDKMGLSSEDIVGKTIEEVHRASCETDRRFQVFERAWAGEKHLFFEGEFNDINYMVRLTPVFKEGTVIEVIGSTLDMTELNKIEKRLLFNEARYRTVVEISPNIIIIHKNSTILYVNRAAIEVMGFHSDKDLIGKRINDFIHPLSYELYKSRMRTFRDARNNSFVEYKVMHPEGKPLYIEALGREIIYDGEKAVLTVGVDVTERKAKEEQLRKSEKLLAESQRIAHIGSWEINLIKGTIFWSDEMYRIFGVSSKKFVPGYDTFISKIPEEERNYVIQANEKVLNGQPFTIEHRIIRLNGEERYVRQQGEVTFDQNGKPTHMIGVLQDITEKREAEIELERSEVKFRSMVQYSSDIISIADENGNILYQSPSSERILGYTSEEKEGKNGFIYNHPAELKKAKDFFEEVLKNPGKPIRSKIRIKHKNGTWLHCEQTATNLLDNPNVRGIVFNIRDVTKQTEYYEQIEHMAFHDELTNVLNKRGLKHLLNQVLKDVKEKDKPFTILFLDLDNFKFVNDSLGHEVGDQLLQIIAVMLKNYLNEKGTVSRFGGDEFVILLTDASLNNMVEKITGDIIQMFSDPFYIDQYQFYITTSIGVVTYPNGGEDIDSLLKNADMAMYKAKTSGKNTYRIFDHEMKINNERTFFIQNNLRTAISNKELILYYQPRIRTDDQSIVGVEALIRWNHPTLGFIEPNDFISIAEESGLIGSLGDWVLETACNQLADWDQEGFKPINMSVNFSTLQFLQHDLSERVKRIMDKYGISPERLEIEITESAVLDQDKGLQENINKLKALGLQISIDDFGTGYSSLVFIKKFHVNTIKIDRTFLINLLDDTNSEEIVLAIINLAKALGLNVVAEGVETVEQFTKLKELNCTEIQGYYFSKPLPNEKVKELFQ